MPPLPRSIDRRAVVAGALAAGALAVPAGLVGLLVDGGPLINLVLFIIIVAAFVTGGLVAGNRRPETPLTHGALAVITLMLVVEVIGTVRRSITGDELDSPAQIAFRFLLAATLGMAGALVASLRRPPAELG